MVPTINDRLGSVLRALQDFIIPALPESEALAVEQARLSWLQINALISQIDIAAAVELKEMQAAEQLLTELGGDVDAYPAITPPAPDPVVMQARRIAILQHVDRLIEQAEGDGDRRTTVCGSVIAYQRVRQPEEARWFAAFGLLS